MAHFRARHSGRKEIDSAGDQQRATARANVNSKARREAMTAKHANARSAGVEMSYGSRVYSQYVIGIREMREMSQPR